MTKRIITPKIPPEHLSHIPIKKKLRSIIRAKKNFKAIKIVKKKNYAAGHTTNFFFYFPKPRVQVRTVHKRILELLRFSFYWFFVSSLSERVCVCVSKKGDTRYKMHTLRDRFLFGGSWYKHARLKKRFWSLASCTLFDGK